MRSPDNLIDIEIVSQPQQITDDGKHSSIVSQKIHGQHETLSNLKQPPAQMETEPDHEASTMLSHSAPTSNKRRYSWWQSLGPIGASILIISTLAIIGSFFILIALWQGAEDAINHRTPKLVNLWRMIVFRDWTTRVITICSAAIRTSVSLQIGVLVSALAAIILESSGARMIDIPMFSIERIQSNPIGILPAVVRQTMNSLVGALNSFIIVTTVMTLLVSNLNSTILLSDLNTALIPAQPVLNNTAISYASRPGQFDTTVLSWRAQPSAQWRFGEARFGENQLGDTGRVYRAFLPFQDETTRTSLEYYSGPAIVANTRTICVPLPLENFSIENKRMGPYIPIGGFVPSLWLREKISVENTYDLIYECAIIPKPEDGRNWATTLCSGDNRYTKPQFIEELNSDKDALLDNERYDMWKIVILNTTADFDPLFENGTTFDSETPKRLQNLSSKSEGLWTRIYDSTGAEMMAATSCYYNVKRPRMYNVTMTGNTISKEPYWDPNNNHTVTHGTDWLGFYKDKSKEILIQFGIGVEVNDTTQRGILQLDIGPLTDDTNFPDRKKDQSADSLMEILREKSIASNTTWDISGITFSHIWGVNRWHSTIFQNILRQTGDPALAVQSVLTRLHQAIYYSQMENYDIIFPVTTTHSTKKLIPVKWRGLCFVLGMVAVHQIQVFVVIVIFISRTKLSALGNAWQAVAQATHVTKALASAESVLDKEIGEWAKTNGHDKDIYVLVPSRQDGKVEIRRKQRRE